MSFTRSIPSRHLLSCVIAAGCFLTLCIGVDIIPPAEASSLVSSTPQAEGVETAPITEPTPDSEFAPGSSCAVYGGVCFDFCTYDKCTCSEFCGFFGSGDDFETCTQVCTSNWIQCIQGCGYTW